MNKYCKHMHNSILLFVTYSDTLNKVLAKKIWHIIWPFQLFFVSLQRKKILIKHTKL